MKSIGRSVWILIAGILVLTLAACGPLENVLPETGGTGTAEPGPAPDLVGTSWRLVSYGEPGSETQVIEGTEVTLQFQDAGQAVGSGGCNSFGAQYRAENGTLTFSEIITTEIACLDENVMEQEQTYYQALQNAGEFEMAEGQLTIWVDGGQRVLNFAEADPA